MPGGERHGALALPWAALALGLSGCLRLSSLLGLPGDGACADGAIDLSISISDGEAVGDAAGGPDGRGDDAAGVHDAAMPQDAAADLALGDMLCAAGSPCQTDGGVGLCAPGGICIPCGNPGMVCCKSDMGSAYCNGSACCVSLPGFGLCLPEGAPNPQENPPAHVCKNGTMVSCGSNNKPCCPSIKCSSGCCIGNYCIKNNDPCSPGSTAMCSSSSKACEEGVWIVCGDSACCLGDPIGSINYCTAPSTICSNGTSCVGECGVPGQACCEGGVCLQGGCCVGGTCRAHSENGCAGGVCYQGSCYATLPERPYQTVGCGGVSQPSCDGGAGCTAPFTFPGSASAVCKQCGSLDQPCCPASSTGTVSGAGYCAFPYACAHPPGDLAQFRCLVCGDDGQPCCQGSHCNNNLVCEYDGQDQRSECTEPERD